MASGKVNYQQWVKTRERCRRFVFVGFLKGVVVGGHTDTGGSSCLVDPTALHLPKSW